MAEKGGERDGKGRGREAVAMGWIRGRHRTGQREFRAATSAAEPGRGTARARRQRRLAREARLTGGEAGNAGSQVRTLAFAGSEARL